VIDRDGLLLSLGVGGVAPISFCCDLGLLRDGLLLSLAGCDGGGAVRCCCCCALLVYRSEELLRSIALMDALLLWVSISIFGDRSQV
jgi:hypothetical protein